jgi:hypothetical protein
MPLMRIFYMFSSNVRRKFSAFVVTTAYFIGCLTPLASALPPGQRPILDANIKRFEIAIGTCSSNTESGEAVDTSPEVLERAIIAFRYLYQHGNNQKFTPPGYLPVQVAGIVGNLMAESGVNPTATEPPPGTGYGIAQWSFGRKGAMRTWVSARNPPNNDPTKMGGQLDFLLHELETSESAADQALRKETTVASATETYMLKFERPNHDPAINHIAKRKVWAQQVYDAAKTEGIFDSATDAGGDNGEIDAGGDSTGCNTETGTGSVECTTATGNAKILCEAKKYEGIYYRWGGGHQGFDAFMKGCPDPSNPPNNIAHSSSAAHNGNPSPCATDCSGLVSIALDQAFSQKFMWTVSSLQGDGAHWQKINMADAKAGDVVTKGDYHVEIVDHMVGNKAFTFGSHQTGTKTGYASGIYSGAYRYIGPGAE